MLAPNQDVLKMHRSNQTQPSHQLLSHTAVHAQIHICTLSVPITMPFPVLMPKSATSTHCFSLTPELLSSFGPENPFDIRKLDRPHQIGIHTRIIRVLLILGTRQSGERHNLTTG